VLGTVRKGDVPLKDIRTPVGVQMHTLAVDVPNEARDVVFAIHVNPFATLGTLPIVTHFRLRIVGRNTPCCTPWSKPVLDECCPNRAFESRILCRGFLKVLLAQFSSWRTRRSERLLWSLSSWSPIAGTVEGARNFILHDSFLYPTYGYHTPFVLLGGEVLHGDV